MGKKKDKKFGAKKPQPTGLLPVNGDDCESMDYGSPAVVTDALNQLQSAEESTRECGCGTLAALASQSGALPVLMGNNVVRILAPLVLDPSACVRHRALGALRNMTVDGGLDICHEMVLKDVLTPLVALFKQYGANWEPEKGQTKHTDTKHDIFTQAVHVLWNLCEASDIAVKVFNKENLLPILLPCLQHSIYGYPLATAVAQCLHTVTENNPEATKMCSDDSVLPPLKSLAEQTDSSSHAVLFQAALMGILVNVLGGELMSSPNMSMFVAALSQTLGMDVVTLVASYAAKEPHVNGAVAEPESSGDNQMQSRTLVEDEVFTSDKEYQDIVNVLNAQRICLELTTNICCSPEEEWEEVDSSESGSIDEMVSTMDVEEEDTTQDNNNFDPLCAPSEVHTAFMENSIMAKVMQLSFPLRAELLEVVKRKKWGKTLMKKFTRVNTHALLCINNLVEAMPADALGGMGNLHQLWDTLAQQVIAPAPPQAENGASPVTPSSIATPQGTDPDLLEAKISAMRAIIQKLSQLGSPKFSEASAADVHFLVQLAEGATSCVQIHMMRIIATIALMLIKVQPQHAVVQEVCNCLLAAATHSGDLVVVAEALDALFDIFADDAMDPLAQSLQLTDRLRAILPQLKAKLQSQKKSLGENYVTVSTSRTNLIRFIKYKDSQGKS